MKKLRHKRSGFIATILPTSNAYYSIHNPSTTGQIFFHVATIPKELIEGSDDWIEIKEYPIGTRVTILNQTVGTYYEKIEDSPALWVYVDPNGMKNFTSVDESLIGTMYEIIEEKPILFTTEDGVDIREGDTCWFTGINYSISSARATRFLDSLYKNTKKFSTKEAANRYMLYNTKRFSYNQIEELVNNQALLKWRDQEDEIPIPKEVGDLLEKLKKLLNK